MRTELDAHYGAIDYGLHPRMIAKRRDVALAREPHSSAALPVQETLGALARPLPRASEDDVAPLAAPHLAHAIACLEIPALPLQLALRANPDWRHHPAIVIASDKPTALVLHANAAARAVAILPGMRYAAARALTTELRASILDEAQLAAEKDELARALALFTPNVEPAGRAVDGRFFLDPSGLERLFGATRSWAESVHRYLTGRGFTSTLVVGYHRFRTEALALASRKYRVFVLRSPEDERDRALAVPLDRLDLSEKLRDALVRLSVHTVGELLRLPGDALRTRFGKDAQALHTAASAGAPLPVQGLVFSEPVQTTVEIEPADDDTTRLLFALRGALLTLAERLVPRGEAVARLSIVLSVERGESATMALEPAQPTRDVALLIDLVRLRFGALVLPSRCTQLDLVVFGVRNPTEQLALFPQKEKRDAKAAARAMARVRAAFGPLSVTRARLRAAHLPEASFLWEPATELLPPRQLPLPGLSDTAALGASALGAPATSTQALDATADGVDDPRRSEGLPRIVRILLPKPLPLPDPPSLSDEPWPTHGQQGPVVRLSGPFRVSGGWWGTRTATAVERDYYWAETRRGDLLWVFYDRPRRRWFLQGRAD